MEDGSDDYSSDAADFDIQSEDVQGRVPFQGLKNRIVANNNDGRFLFGSYNFFSLLRTSTSTATVLTTVTSTITSATVKTCAGSAQFIATTACRRRRSVEDFAAAAIVAPSPVEP